MPWKSTGPLTISLPPTRYLELAQTMETHKSVDRMVTAHHLALDQSPHTIRQRKARKRQGIGASSCSNTWSVTGSACVLTLWGPWCRAMGRPML